MRINPLIVSLSQLLHERFLCFILFVFLLQRVKKTICNEGTPSTPRVVIRFLTTTILRQLKVQSLSFKKLIKRAYRVLRRLHCPTYGSLQNYTRYAVIISNNNSITTRHLTI